VGLAGAASGQLVDGVVHLRPEGAMAEAMLQGWRAEQTARGLRAKTIGARERLVRRLVAFTSEFPCRWIPGHVDEWTLTLTAGHHLAPATVRGYQTELRLFGGYLTDARYRRAAACEREFGPGVHPVPICHQRNTIAHLDE
jgi:integrase/recombinase XerC